MLSPYRYWKHERAQRVKASVSSACLLEVGAAAVPLLIATLEEAE